MYNKDNFVDEDEDDDDPDEVVLRANIQLISADFRARVAQKFFRIPKSRRSNRSGRSPAHHAPMQEPENDVPKRVRGAIKEYPAHIVRHVMQSFKTGVKPFESIRLAGYEYNGSTKGHWTRLKWVGLMVLEEQHQMTSLLITPSTTLLITPSTTLHVFVSYQTKKQSGMCFEEWAKS